MREIDGNIYLNTAEALHHVGGRSYSWIIDRVTAGTLPKYHIEGHPYYRIADLDQAMTPVLLPQPPPTNGQHAQEEEEVDYYTLAEVARKLSVSRSWVWQMCKEGKIEYKNLTGMPRRGAKLRIHKDTYARLIGAL